MAVIAMLIIGVSLWYTNHLVKSIAEQEVKQVKMWAAAMEQHAVMMKSTRHGTTRRDDEIDGGVF